MLFVTVEHTGTHETIRRFGLPVRSIRECGLRDPWPFTHLWDTHMPEILRAAERMPILTTERPYEDVRATWERNGKDLHELDAQWRNWERLQALNPWVLKLGAR